MKALRNLCVAGLSFVILACGSGGGGGPNPPGGSNSAPVAIIVADPLSGSAPAVVSFDAATLASPASPLCSTRAMLATSM